MLSGVYVAAGLVAAIAGIVLSATVNVYVPHSGNAFLLDAIGGTFIGTTLGRNGRPGILGTLVGVLLVATVANGLLLTGISFYWRQVATGLLILTVLAASFRKARRPAGRREDEKPGAEPSSAPGFSSSRRGTVRYSAAASTGEKAPRSR